MDHLKDLHGIEVFTIALAINALIWTGKFVWGIFQKKSEERDQSHKALKVETSEKDHQLEEKTVHLNAKMERLEGRLDHLINNLSSYMETTIEFSIKIGGVEKQLEHLSEKLEAFEKFMGEFR